MNYFSPDIRWTPEPTATQVRRARRLKRTARLCSVICVVGFAYLFYFDAWPSWVGYVFAGLGLASWPLHLMSRDALEPYRGDKGGLFDLVDEGARVTKPVNKEVQEKIDRTPPPRGD